MSQGWRGSQLWIRRCQKPTGVLAVSLRDPAGWAFSVPRQSLWASGTVIMKPTQGGGGCSYLGGAEPLAQEGSGDKGPRQRDEMQERTLSGILTNMLFT